MNKYYLGVCAMDLDGKVLEAGDTRVPFTIQSISKLVSLILAIRDCGADHLFHEKVGVEPTGDPFNSIVKLETRTRPFNPFINAGAITVASCIKGKDADEKFGRFLEFTRKLCDNDAIELNHPVYESERATGVSKPGTCLLSEGIRDTGGRCGGMFGLLFPDVFL